MKIEVKDKDTGKNVKEADKKAEIELPKPKKAEKAEKVEKTEKQPEKKTDKKSKKKADKKVRRRKAPLAIIITAIIAVGIITGVIILVVKLVSRSNLVGTWVRENDVWTYEFKADGTGTYGLGFGTPMSFHYKDNGDSIEITRDSNNSQSTYEYHFEGEKLVIKDQLGKNQAYNKKD